MRSYTIVGVLALALAPSVPAAPPASGEITTTRMRVDQSHVRQWNQFVDDCYALHQRLVAGRKIREAVSLGGYVDQPKFYRRVEYFDAANDRLISRIDREREHPDRIHGIEVYVYDDQGRVVRDYGASFLPEHRNAPVQTLINLHHYNGALHSFRQFDAGGDNIYEYCEGEYEGKPVQIRLFEDDLVSTDPDIVRLLAGPQYQACFAGLPAKAGKWLKPQ